MKRGWGKLIKDCWKHVCMHACTHTHIYIYTHHRQQKPRQKRTHQLKIRKQTSTGVNMNLCINMTTEAWPQFSFPFTHVHPSTHTHTHQQWTELPHQFCLTSSYSPYKEQQTVNCLAKHWHQWQWCKTKHKLSICHFRWAQMHPCTVHPNSHKHLCAYKCSVCILTSGCCWSERSSITTFADAAVVQNVRFLLRPQSVCSVCSTGRTSLVSEVWIWQNEQSESSAYKQM